jgi:hypothetical protein
MENISFQGKIFQWKRIHPRVNNFVKTIYLVSKEDKEHRKTFDSPLSYNEVVEGEQKLDESKAPEWMDA